MLSGPEIVHHVNLGRRLTADERARAPRYIAIEPFREAHVGPNSVDLCLDNTLRVYDDGLLRAPDDRTGVLGHDRRVFGYHRRPDGTGEYDFDPTCYGVRPVDMRAKNPTVALAIPETGLLLVPGRVYLGSTVEATACRGCVPRVDGRSSVGRLGVSVTCTAGFGDDGFGMLQPGGCTWTLQLHAQQLTVVYPFERICQLSFVALTGDEQPYRGKYAQQTGPTASKKHEDRPVH